MLVPGSSFGPYDVIGLLGAGGMGEVYRARDRRLNRDVALKVLPDAVARDPDRIARFAREAQSLAALSHPHIATIFGVEEHEGQHGLVLELVEGPTLVERLRTGPLDWREALSLATHIADAVAAAHERGIVHRDLKPANIKLTPDGAIKILDFGLAKAIEGTAQAVRQDPDNSPTITTPAMTNAGIILGTAAYMSPEQARGGAIDHRTDVWAFGCVLFEMLTGKRAFAGDTVSDTLAAVLRAEPDSSAIPPSVPRAVHRVLARCLDKDRRRRFADLGDVRFEIEEALHAPDVEPGPRQAAGTWPKLIGATIVLTAGLTAIVTRAVLPTVEPPPTIKFNVTLPARMQVSVGPQHGFVWGVDGQTLYFAARTDESLVADSIFKVSLNDFGIHTVAEGFDAPFVSADGRWLGMNRASATYKMSTTGGAPVLIPGTTGLRSSWTTDGRIMFSDGRGGLAAMSGDGGDVVSLSISDGRTIGFPVSVSDDLILAPAFQGGASPRIVAINPLTHTLVDVVEGSGPAVIGDFLTFTRAGGALWAAPFERSRRRVTGSAVPLITGLMSGMMSTGAYAVSVNGHLAYVPSGPTEGRTLVWVDRSGAMTDALADRGAYAGPRLSPDGRQLAVSDGDGIWVIDLTRLTRVRLGSIGLNHTRPVWTGDSMWVVFLASGDMYRQRSDGSGAPEKILDRPEAVFPDGVGPQNTIAFNTGGGAPRDIWLLRDGKPEAFLTTQSNERGGAFSPRGEFIAYVSDESGRDEVYVRRFPGPSAKTAVSTAGGQGPVWSRDGSELFYRERTRLMSVRVGPNGELSAPVALFPLDPFLVDPNQAAYDVAADGKFIFVRRENSAERSEIRFVLNWIEEVKARVGR